jgi:hypothetical protein
VSPIPLGQLAAGPLMAEMVYGNSVHPHFFKAIAPANFLTPGNVFDNAILAVIKVRPSRNILL